MNGKERIDMIEKIKPIAAKWGLTDESKIEKIAKLIESANVNPGKINDLIEFYCSFAVAESPYPKHDLM